MKIFDINLRENLKAWKSSVYLALGFSLLMLVTQGFFRFLLYILFRGTDPNLQWSSYVFDSFLLGLRFDFAVANYFLIIPCLVSCLVFLSFNSKIIQKYKCYERSYFTLAIILSSFLALCNLTFYSYFKDHFNLLVFGLLEDDTEALLVGLWKNEPIVLQILGILVFIFLIRKALRFLHEKSLLWSERSIFPAFLFPLYFLIWIIFVGLGARGSLNYKMHPLNRIHTEVSPYYFLNQLSFSPIYALKDAMVIKNNIQKSDYDLVKEMGYLGKESQAVSDFKMSAYDIGESSLQYATKTSSIKAAGFKQPHVVVFAMESMGSFWLSFDSDKFPILGKMKKHMDQDAVNWNFLPAGSGTYSSVTHWLLNMAEIPGVAAAEKIIDRGFVTSAVNPFKAAGYKTSYVYGGGLGWRNLSGFLYRLGFEDLHGETRIKEAMGDVKETHDWGLFDGDLFRYVEKLLEDATSPQFIFVLSTTNHPPFTVPSSFEKPNFEYPKELSDRFTQKSDTILSRMQAYRYSMDSLGTFLDQAKKEKWGENIVIAASGDHSFYESVQFYPEDYYEWKGVPFYLYSSIDFSKEVFESNYGAHQDIFPSLYELSLSGVEYKSMGHSLITKTNYPSVTGGAVIDGVYALLGDRLYKRVESKKYQLLNEEDDISRAYKKRLNAYIAIAADLLKQEAKK